MTDNTRALLEQALEALEIAYSTEYDGAKIHGAKLAIRAALAAPDDIAAEMSAVADQYAHKLALDLECVLADYSGTWYDTAIGTLGAYREAMNAIHERQSPTFMGEPVLRDEPDKPADKPPTPTWHDAPTEPGLWLNSINHYAELVSQHWIDRGVVANSHARWYGPIPQDTEAEGGAA